jgi:hypothetical protein
MGFFIICFLPAIVVESPLTLVMTIGTPLGRIGGLSAHIAEKTLARFRNRVDPANFGTAPFPIAIRRDPCWKSNFLHKRKTPKWSDLCVKGHTLYVL